MCAARCTDTFPMMRAPVIFLVSLLFHSGIRTKVGFDERDIANRGRKASDTHLLVCKLRISARRGRSCVMASMLIDAIMWEISRWERL